MYKVLCEFIEKLQDTSEVTVDLIPIEMVDVFEKYYSPKLGTLLMQFKHKGLDFSVDVVSVNDYSNALDLMQRVESEEEKIVYALYVLGLFNKAAYDGVERFVGNLLGKGV